MRKPEVDYREFRLRKINEPQFSHLKLLFGWVGYFAMYYLTEKLILPQHCMPMRFALDDMIPFCEYFAIPYVLWYLLVAGSLLYFMLYDVESFKALMKFIIITQIVAITAYVLFPTRQDLRPIVFPRDNFFTDIMKMIYSVDTNTNVCPSMHVAYSLGIASVWLKSKDTAKWIKAGITVFCLLVCISTAFVKQHSVIDIFAAALLCILAEMLVFHKSHYSTYFRRLRRAD